jgi:hypothetical protein
MRHRLVLVPALVSAVALAGACGGNAGPGPADDARAARAVAQRVIDGLMLGRDPDAACAAMTPDAQANAAARTPRLALGAEPPTGELGMIFTGSLLTAAFDDVRATAGAVTVTGDDAVATIDYAGAIRDQLDVPSARVRLRRVDGRWLVTSTDAVGRDAATG